MSKEWVEQRSVRGYTYRVWREVDLPQIEQRYLDCSVYLYASRQSAEAGERFGGSGCLVSVESTPIFDPQSFKGGMYLRVSTIFPPHLYAVTNKHVARGGFPVIRLNTVDGSTDILELEHNDWIPHPDGDDLAVAPIDLPRNKHQYFPISPGQFVHQDSVRSEVGAGDDTFMVGRFINHDGTQRNTPSIRFGSIAMLPFERVKLESGYMQEAFLVETRSISGYSGSPVFIYRPMKEKIRTPGRNPFDLSSYSHLDGRKQETITNLMGIPLLLGIDCGHVRKVERVLDGARRPHPHGWHVEGNTGMAIVIPAWRLDGLLNSQELMMERKRKDEEYLKQKEAEATVVSDVEKPDPIFNKSSYEDALRRASSRVSEPESEKKQTSD